MVTNRTRMLDFLRAGIARRVPVVDAAGKPVMVGEGADAKPKTRISVEDNEGRVIDLHALRTTLGTQLARAGVTPQVAQRVMRHSDYRTTLKHYTVLGLTDTAKAVARLPGVKPAGDQVQAATGTTDAVPLVGSDPQRYCQQMTGESGRDVATQRVHEASGRDRVESKNPQHSPGVLRFSRGKKEVERKGLEPSTPSLQS